LSDPSVRSRQFLEWRIRIFIAGALIALVGIYFDEQWITGLAIVVLITGFFIRFLPSTYLRKLDPESSEGSAIESEELT